VNIEVFHPFRMLPTGAGSAKKNGSNYEPLKGILPFDFFL
jgi:hypothetical protein